LNSESNKEEIKYSNFIIFLTLLKVNSVNNLGKYNFKSEFIHSINYFSLKNILLLIK